MNKKHFIWNLIGSTIYAITSMLLGTAVMRILNADAGGIFLFAFSTFGQHMYTISYFGMRSIHITDIGNEFSFGDYRRFRIITCLAAVAFSVIFACIYAHDNATKLAVIILMSLYKILDGFCDCYESEFQRDGRLDVTGQSLTFRTLFVVAVFISVMVLSQNLIWSCISAVIALAIACLFCCELRLRKFDNVNYVPNCANSKPLFDAGKWLFISTFLDMYILCASKYAIDMTQTAAVSGYFSILFIPTSVINLMAYFVIRPLVTVLTRDYEDGKMDSFKTRVKNIALIICGITVFCIIAAYFLAIPVLGIFVGQEIAGILADYRVALAIMILGGGFYAELCLYYYALVIMKREKDIFFIYILGTVAATPICYLGAKLYGINGAAVAYTVAMGITTLLFYADYRRGLKKA